MIEKAFRNEKDSFKEKCNNGKEEGWEYEDEESVRYPGSSQ